MYPDPAVGIDRGMAGWEEDANDRATRTNVSAGRSGQTRGLLGGTGADEFSIHEPRSAGHREGAADTVETTRSMSGRERARRVRPRKTPFPRRTPDRLKQRPHKDFYQSLTRRCEPLFQGRFQSGDPGR